MIIRNLADFQREWKSLKARKMQKEADKLRRWWNNICYGFVPSAKYKYEPDPIKDVEMSDDKVDFHYNGDITVGGILHDK